MPHIEELSEIVLDSIKTQLIEWIPYLEFESLKKAPIELGETLAVWAFENRPASKLVDCVFWPGTLHHQIVCAGEATLYARSERGEPDELADENQVGQRVTSVWDSPLAGAVSSGLSWINQNIAEDDVVRLLYHPWHHLHVLWLYSEAGSRIYAPLVPQYFTAINAGALYTEQEFFDALKNEIAVGTIVVPTERDISELPPS